MSRLNSGPRIQSYSNNIGGEISVMFSTLGSPFVPGSSVTKAPPDYSSPVLRVCYVGAGYVGGTNAAITALTNPSVHVSVVDTDRITIDRWKSQHLPIKEAELDVVIRITRDGLRERDSTRSQRAANLRFSTDCNGCISEADIIFLAVSTPTKTHGEGAGLAIDIGDLKMAVQSIAVEAKPGAIIVEKSTVPCKTAKMIQDVLQFCRPGVPFEVLSNPEFLTEGTAVIDALHPSRVLIGSGKTTSALAAAETLASLYHWIPPERILRTNVWSSELAKLASNALLAQRISSINTISAMCEATGADIAEVSRAVGMDDRIGSSYLESGLGFGGSCLKKDTLGLAYLADFFDLPEVAAYWKIVIQNNTWQVDRFVKKVINSFHGTLRGQKLAILGYAFKENRSDSRESQSIQVIRKFLQERPQEITIFDPGCESDLTQDELLQTFNPLNCSIKMCSCPKEACDGASAVLILTPWEIFKYPPALAKDPIRTGPEKSDWLVSQTDGYIRLVTARNLENQEGYLRPHPARPVDCIWCIKRQSKVGSTAQWQQLDWTSIIQRMKQPKWVFDTRRQVQVKDLEKLGCKVFRMS